MAPHPLIVEDVACFVQYVLAFGNYMNAGTAKGQAYGFKLECLNRVNSNAERDPVIKGSSNNAFAFAAQSEQDIRQQFEFVGIHG
jgi:hypothetical protein